MRAIACFSEVDNFFRDLAISQALPIPRMKPNAIFQILCLDAGICGRLCLCFLFCRMCSPVDFVNGDPNAGEAYGRGGSRCYVIRIKTHRFRSQALAFLRVLRGTSPCNYHA